MSVKATMTVSIVPGEDLGSQLVETEPGRAVILQ
jgi:hypothetical protein